MVLTAWPKRVRTSCRPTHWGHRWISGSDGVAITNMISLLQRSVSVRAVTPPHCSSVPALSRSHVQAWKRTFQVRNSSLGDWAVRQMQFTEAGQSF